MTAVLNRISQLSHVRFAMRLALALLLVVVLTKAQLWSFLTGAVPLWDFDVYYQTARDAWAGVSPYQVPYMQTAGPPLVVAPYLLFALVPLSMARTLITLVNLGAGVMATWLLARSLTKRWVPELALLFNLFLWAGFPARFSLLLGQPNLVMMLAITVLLSQLPKTSARTRWWQAGAVATSVVIKTNMVLLWLSLLRAQRTMAVQVVALLVGVLLLTAPVLLPRYYQEYAGRTRYYTSAAVTLADVDYYNQSLRSTLGRLGVGSWAPTAFFLVVVVASAYLLLSGDRGAGVLLSLLASPIVWQHYVVLAFPVVMLLLVPLIKARAWRRVLVVLVALFMLMAEFPWLHGAPLGDWRSLLASHYFVGLVLLLVLWIRWSSSRTPTKQW